jgi:hypothetical protein
MEEVIEVSYKKPEPYYKVNEDWLDETCPDCGCRLLYNAGCPDFDKSCRFCGWKHWLWLI